MKALVGTVTSDKMAKTVVVEVTTQWQHPLYKKVVKRTKKYLAHDEDQSAKVGDTVSITPHKPISKRKRWQLEKIIETVKS